jgi:transitional endoplasmic reticulum ATPase
MDRYETYQIRKYALAALKNDGGARVRRPRRAMAAWLFDHAALLGSREPAIDRDQFDPPMGRIDRESWARFRPLLTALDKVVVPPRPSSLERRLTWLGEMLKLSDLEADLLRVAVRAALAAPLRALVTSNEGGLGRSLINERGFALLTGHGQRAIERALQPGQPLLLLGLLEDRQDGDFSPSSVVMRVARLTTADPRQLRAALVGDIGRAELAWEDFAHLGEDADLAQSLLEGALAKRAQGVNILLHGAPGTGKTQFVRTLAARLGVEAIFVGETDSDGDEPHRNERIAAFAIARSLAAQAGRTLLVVDEADDIFTSVDHGQAYSRVGSKVFMNRLVERTAAPTIWITNHGDRLGPAVLRRMALAIRFPEPGREVRRRVAERIAARRKLRLTAAALDGLADLAAAPALIDSAMRVAKLTGGGVAHIQRAARSVSQAMEGPIPPPAHAGATAFDPALSAADHDLADLARRIAAAGRRAVSFCFHGPPGTGKSAYARYLAIRMGLDVIEKRASDLLDMYLGETEKRIARAFEEAADRRAMLILDEADSLLRDRAGAHRAWEVSQVNEMLTWMERHPWPLVCTTNLMTSLDPATLRRFVFKVKFLPMTTAQAREAFTRAFGMAPPAELDGLDNLTPGDFALVARKADVLGERGVAALVAMLADEVAAKSGGAKRRIGF